MITWQWRIFSVTAGFPRPGLLSWTRNHGPATRIRFSIWCRDHAIARLQGSHQNSHSSRRAGRHQNINRLCREDQNRNAWRGSTPVQHLLHSPLGGRHGIALRGRHRNSQRLWRTSQVENRQPKHGHHQHGTTSSEGHHWNTFARWGESHCIAFGGTRLDHQREDCVRAVITEQRTQVPDFSPERSCPPCSLVDPQQLLFRWPVIGFLSCVNSTQIQVTNNQPVLVGPNPSNSEVYRSS